LRSDKSIYLHPMKPLSFLELSERGWRAWSTGIRGFPSRGNCSRRWLAMPWRRGTNP